VAPSSSKGHAGGPSAFFFSVSFLGGNWAAGAVDRRISCMTRGGRQNRILSGGEMTVQVDTPSCYHKSFLFWVAVGGRDVLASEYTRVFRLGIACLPCWLSRLRLEFASFFPIAPSLSFPIHKGAILGAHSGVPHVMELRSGRKKPGRSSTWSLAPQF